MKYKLIGKNNYFNPIETVLNNRGIKDVQRFLEAGNNPNEEHHYSHLKNIDKAVECLIKHLKDDSNIFVQVDPDVDGYLSSAMFINYLNRYDSSLNIKWRNQTGKQHEIKSKNVPDNIDLVVVIDAGSNDIKEHKKLKQRGMDVIVIDHHEFDKESDYAIIVNNQDGSYPNRLLSATGVLYKFLQALDDKLNVNYSKDYLDLAAIGIVGDMISLNSMEGQYYVHQGLKNIKNPLMKELYKEQEYSTKGIISPTTTSFFIAPLFNATVRGKDMDNKDQLFKSLLDDGTSEIYYERNKENEPLIKNTIRMMKRSRQQQNKIVDESVERIREKIEEKDLLKNKILIVEVTDLLDKNYTGLVANRLLNSSDVKRPVLIIRYNEKNDMLSGSGRGYDKGVIKDFRSFLNESGYFEFADGHASAFGLGIYADNLIEFNDYVNKKYKDVDFGTNEYEVDFIISSDSLRSDIIREIDSSSHLWGRGVEEPLIAVEGLEAGRRGVGIIGKAKNTIKFSYKGIEYIKFRASEDEIKLLTEGEPNEQLTINIVGKCSVNEFRGAKTPQIVLEDFEIVEVKERRFPF